MDYLDIEIHVEGTLAFEDGLSEKTAADSIQDGITEEIMRDLVLSNEDDIEVAVKAEWVDDDE